MIVLTYYKKIGYACTPLSIPYKTTRSCILKNFSKETLMKCVKENLNDLLHILHWNVEHDIFMFRISSDIIPFGSHSINQIKWWDSFQDELKECGQFIIENGIRVSMHPGQYTVLNSPKEDIVEKSVKDLEYHCRFLDSLEVDYTNKIILHVGGIYSNKELAIQRFIENFSRLSPSAQKRLVIENDDKSYNIEDVLMICNQLNIPAVFDNLHHKINPCPFTWDEIIEKVAKTWKTEDGPVKFHYSDQDEIKKGGAHSKTVNTKNFIEYMKRISDIEADVMLEVKDKEISALKCIYSISNKIERSIRSEQWAKYKYCVMEKSNFFYEECSRLINSEEPMSKFYSCIDECLRLPYEEADFKNTVEHIYGYLKYCTTTKEKDKLEDLIEYEIKNTMKIKNELQKLCKKYKIDSLNQSYYFVY